MWVWWWFNQQKCHFMGSNGDSGNVARVNSPTQRRFIAGKIICKRDMFHCYLSLPEDNFRIAIGSHKKLYLWGCINLRLPNLGEYLQTNRERETTARHIDTIFKSVYYYVPSWDSFWPMFYISFHQLRIHFVIDWNPICYSLNWKEYVQHPGILMMKTKAWCKGSQRPIVWFLINKQNPQVCLMVKYG